MKAPLIFLLVTAVTAFSAEPTRTPFTLPRPLPVSVALVLDPGGSIASKEKTGTGETIAAQLPGKGTAGLVVEVSDSAGRLHWRHDFGFNSSQINNSIGVSCHPTLPLILVEYKGYKWDHDHILLFIERSASKPAIREYATAKTDILPLLRRQKDFMADFEYWIYPSGFVPRGVTFECVALQKPERKSAHPFAQDQKWFRVTATVSDVFTISPTDVTASH